jgi:hypothetical protein
MSWFKRKPKNVIPNPRGKKRVDPFEHVQRDLLRSLQFLVFALAIVILIEVSV